GMLGAVVLQLQLRGGQGRAQALLHLGHRGAGAGGRALVTVVHHVHSGLKSIAAELMQKRSPLGSGPSGKTWPRCEPQRWQRTSMRTMPWLASTTRSTTSALTGAQ